MASWLSSKHTITPDDDALLETFAYATAQVIKDAQATFALQENERKTRAILNQTFQFTALLTLDGNLVEANRSAMQFAGVPETEVIGKPFWDTSWWAHDSKSQQRLKENIKALATGRTTRFEATHQATDGSLHYFDYSLKPIKDEAGHIMYLLAEGRDITESKRMERELAQSQKLEAVGQLAAGIAHEINTPTQYVGDNLCFLRDSFNGLNQALAASEKLLAAARHCAITEDLTAEAEAAIRKADFDYLQAEIPKAIQQSLDGVERVGTIVRAMKEFAHPDGGLKQLIDLNRAIDSALTISRNEWKYVADLVTDYDPDLPPVPCLAGDFNQVMLNLVVNAAQAIGNVVDKNGHGKGTLTVRTRHVGDWVEIRVEDTGTGIPASIRHRVFEQFFTTKEVGKGTGLGLSIAHALVVQKHGGTITFETEEGNGSTFIVRLPLTDHNSMEPRS